MLEKIIPFIEQDEIRDSFQSGKLKDFDRDHSRTPELSLGKISFQIDGKEVPLRDELIGEMRKSVETRDIPELAKRHPLIMPMLMASTQHVSGTYSQSSMLQFHGLDRSIMGSIQEPDRMGKGKEMVEGQVIINGTSGNMLEVTTTDTGRLSSSANGQMFAQCGVQTFIQIDLSTGTVGKMGATFTGFH